MRPLPHFSRVDGEAHHEAPLTDCNRSVFLVLALFGGTSAAAQQTGRGSAVRPNILWITTEDMSPRLGSYGDTVARTPVLDELARQSIRYTRAFTTAPVCSASRGAIITGMHQASIGAQHHRTREEAGSTIAGSILYASACATPSTSKPSPGTSVGE